MRSDADRPIMLVEMVMLRTGGQKLSREQLRSRVPVRGDLSMFERRHVAMAAVLPEGKRLPDNIPTLEEPRLTRIRGESFVLVGYESFHLRGETKRYRQAWWCRLPGARVPGDLSGAPATYCAPAGAATAAA